VKKLVADVKKLWKHAAAVGFAIAVTCHLIPQEYRTACDLLAQLCQIDR
jgi:hypothetical protein